MGKQRILVTVKTYPTLSSNYPPHQSQMDLFLNV